MQPSFADQTLACLACKLIAERYAPEFVAWCLDLPTDQAGQVVVEKTDLPAHPIGTDAVLLLPDRQLLVHVEFQVAYSPDLPARMWDCYLRLRKHYSEDIRIRQFLIVLTERGGSAEAAYRQGEIFHGYSLIEIWRLEGRALLKREVTIPFAVLGKW
ncbi:MAG: hypothetical protein RMM31_10675 [Anaerolineae bacterium]|nr:hypothetical protein [Thermoflexales bacterium]MDW8396693.1 hypothetical protein [Anaerolineae bacterium]